MYSYVNVTDAIYIVNEIFFKSRYEGIVFGVGEGQDEMSGDCYRDTANAPEGNMNVRGKCHLNQSRHFETINLMFTLRCSQTNSHGNRPLGRRWMSQAVAEAIQAGTSERRPGRR